MALGTLIGLGAGALSGAAKATHKGAQADRQRKLAAETQRYSPWTGMQAGAVEEANPVGDMFGGGLAGAQFGQQFDKPKADPFAAIEDKAKKNPLTMTEQANPYGVSNPFV